MTDIVEFLAARIAEDQAVAEAASGRDPKWWDSGPGYPEAPEIRITNDRDDVIVAETGELAARHIVRHDPARVLAEVKAKRRVLELAIEMIEDEEFRAAGTTLMCNLATPYDQHPGYDPAWRVE